MMSKRQDGKRWDRGGWRVLVCGFAMLALLHPLLEAGAGTDFPGSQAESRPAAAAAAPTGSPPALTAADLEAFLDGLIPLQLEQRGIAGAVVVVVQHGRVLLAKGYGHADVEEKAPVSPETTLFRPGSVSKLFTWTAVMQLMEQGRLDLDQDVNTYLDFEVPAAFDAPVTLRYILTHTAGFEERLKDLFVTDPGRMLSLRDYLISQIPERIYPPGTVVAYSNYATALAGYIVERASGQPFEEYVAENIFRPLGMEYSTFAQPLPEALQPHMSKGYLTAAQPPRPFELIPAAPAGSLSSSGLDMARFILAHLQEGRYGEARILRPETVELMHARQWGTHADVNGMALGFYEESRNGLRIIGHGGDTIQFHSDLHLIPEAGIGFFFSQNSAGRGTGMLRSAIWQGFLDRYFPYTPPAAAADSRAAEDIRTVTGAYIASRRNQTTFLRATAMLGGNRVIPRGEDTIEISGLEGFFGKTIKWQWVGPLRFRDADGQDIVAFRRDADGRLEAALSVLPVFVFQRVPWYQSSRLLLLLFGFAMAVFALALILWGLGAWLRWHYGRRLDLSPRERRVRILARLACGLILLYVVGFLVLGQFGQKDIGIFNTGLDPVLILLQAVGWLGALGMLVVLYDAVLCWSHRERGWVARTSSAFLVLACVSWTWFLVVCNALSLNLRY
jgi:CubicO group peptidase (beta-lactamase class C family)